jgi:hypothetical protein
MKQNNVLIEHYEALRQRAIGQQSAGVIWGLVVLRTKGMASWVKSWQKYAGGGMPSPKKSVPGAYCLPSSSGEVVQVLAAMVWALQKESA